MLFNSLTFLIFLPLVFGLYWFVGNRNLRLQNLLIVVASYVFYGWWDWRFLGLIAFTTTWSYVAGLIESDRIDRGKSPSKLLVTISLLVNFGILAYFKYANFFIDSAEGVLAALGFKADFPTLHIILPVGISFYTFQALSYTIDIYCRKLHPTRDPVAFFAFISFFPQLVAGPIERATNLLPQFLAPRSFDADKALHGLCLIFYGLFKKMVVADNLSIYVDSAFATPQLYNGLTCVIAAFFFSIQIYCDFSGYSDCARGVAKLFGFELMLNFDRPYLSRSFAEFWRRWHISLSSWFRDYVYIPLGGSRVPFPTLLRNVWIVFLLSGLWHGAAWTFVAWGALHALYLTVGLLRRRLHSALSPVDAAASPRHVEPQSSPHQVLANTFSSLCANTFSSLFVFTGVTFAWIVFRSNTFSELGHFLHCMFTGGLRGSTLQFRLFAERGPLTFLICMGVIALLALSYLAPRDCAFKSTRGQLAFIFIAMASVVFLASPVGGEFIYFQF